MRKLLLISIFLISILFSGCNTQTISLNESIPMNITNLGDLQQNVTIINNIYTGNVNISSNNINDSLVSLNTTYSSSKIESLVSGINGTYFAGYGLNLNSSKAFNVNNSIIQQRVNDSCASGSSIRVINSDGTVVCESDSTGSNNYPTSLTFLNDILTLGRNGLSDLTTTINLSNFINNSLYRENTILYSNNNNTPLALNVGINTVVGRINGGITTLAIDGDLTTVSLGNDSIPSAIGVKLYIDTNFYNKSNIDNNFSNYYTKVQSDNNWSKYLLLTDQRFNETTYIQNNYPTFNYVFTNYLNISDQKYNNTLLINGVNTSGNIKGLGFNLTTELDNKYLGVNDQRYNETTRINGVNTTSNIQGLGFNTTSQLDTKYYPLNSNPNAYYTSYLNFTSTLTDAKICIWNSTTSKIQCDYTDQTSAGGGYATIQDEGSALTQRTTINFIGTGVSCVDNAGSTRTDCTISSSGGSGDGTGGWTNDTFKTVANLNLEAYGNNVTTFNLVSNARKVAKFEDFGYVVATYQRITTAPTIDTTETSQDGNIMNFPSAASVGGDGGYVMSGGTATNLAIINVTMIDTISTRAKMVATTNRNDLIGAFKTATTVNMLTAKTGVFFMYGTNLTNATIHGMVCNAGTCTNVTTINADTNWHEYTIVSNANATTAATQFTFYVDGVNYGTISTNIPTTQISTIGTWVESSDTTADTLRIDWFHLSMFRRLS